MVTQYSTSISPTGEKLYTASADPIDVAKLGSYSTPPVAPTDNTNYSGIVSGGVVLADDAVRKAQEDKANTLEQQKIANAPSAQDTLLKQLGEISTPSSVDLYNQQYNQAGIADKEKEVSNLTAQLRAIQAESQAGALATVGQGRGITQSIIGGQQAQIERQAAIKSLPIQAQLAAAQGNLQLAQDRLNTSFKLASEDADRQYQREIKQIEYAMQFADKKETRRLEEMALEKKNALDAKNALIKYKQDIGQELRNSGQGNLMGELSAAQTQEQVDAVASKIVNPSASLDLQIKQAQLKKLNAETARLGTPTITNPEAGKYSGALSVILGSTKLTSAQKATVINAINNGQEPFAVIKNQAKDIMGQTEATTLSKYETAQATLANIGQQLSDFYRLGGKTSLIKGSLSEVANRLGTVTDPKLVNLATQIKGNLAVYRNAISGTAYSEQEGRDIASIFPGINKSETLNRAILDARDTLFNSVIDSTYRNVLGNAYDLAKGEKTKDEAPELPPISNTTETIGSGAGFFSGLLNAFK